MNYLEKIQKFFELEKLAQKRLNQLKQEEQLDIDLKEKCKECPRLVLEFMFKSRELNRKLTRETLRAPCLDYPEKVEKAISTIDKLLIFPVSCTSLRELNNRIDLLL